MLATAQNLHHNPVQGSKTPAGTFAPRLQKYLVRVHFPVLWVGKTRIPAGVDRKVVWGTSPLDACRWMMGYFTAAEWVEVIG